MKHINCVVALFMGMVSLQCIAVEIETWCSGYAEPDLAELSLVGNVREVVSTRTQGLPPLKEEIRASFSQTQKPLHLSKKVISGEEGRQKDSSFEYDQDGNLIRLISTFSLTAKQRKENNHLLRSELVIRQLQPGYRAINSIDTWHSAIASQNGRNTRNTYVERTMQLPNGGRKRICVAIDSQFGMNSITDFHPTYLRVKRSGVFKLHAQPHTIDEAMRLLSRIDREIPSLDPAYYDEYAFGIYGITDNGYDLYVNGKLVANYDRHGNRVHEKTDFVEFILKYKWDANGNWVERETEFISSGRDARRYKYSDWQNVEFW